MHVLDRYPGQLSFAGSNNEVSVRKHSDDGDSQAEEPFNWPHSLVDGLLDVDFKDVSSLGPAVHVGILEVDGCTGELPLDVPEVGVERLDLLVYLVDGEDLNPVLLNSDQAVVVVVEKQNLVYNLFVGSPVETFSRVHVPDHQHVPISVNEYLSSRHPCEASSLESAEKERLVTDCLWSLNL